MMKRNIYIGSYLKVWLSEQPMDTGDVLCLTCSEMRRSNYCHFCGEKAKFIDSSPLLYLKRNGILHSIYSKKDFINLFYAQKKEVRKYLSRTKVNIKNANKIQLISLIQYCDEISSTSKE